METLCKDTCMDIVWVCIMYGLLLRKKCMEWYGSFVSWVKLDLWFCFGKDVFWLKEFW